MGVEVYTTDIRRLPSRLRQLFLLDSEGRIAWEVHTDADRRITRVVATADLESIDSYRRICSELFDLAETKRYESK